MVSAPTLHTRRLVLRGHQECDLDDCEALWTDPTVIRHTTGVPVARQDVWTRLLRHSGHWALFGFGYWLAFERTTERFVGEVGVARFKRDLLANLPELDPLPEAGWVLMPWTHGQGYASEAVDAALRWRDEHVASSGTFCIIRPKNEPSLRLAWKRGFQAYKTVSQANAEWLVLMRP